MHRWMFHCAWHSISEEINWLPKVDIITTHLYAPLQEGSHDPICNGEPEIYERLYYLFTNTHLEASCEEAIYLFTGTMTNLVKSE